MPEPTSSPVTTTAAVRTMAQAHGVDLDTITGTGVGGRTTRSDVLTAAGQAERAKTLVGTQTADDHLFDKVWGQASEQPETDAAYLQMWGSSSAESEVHDEVLLAQVFGH
jgi:pyruvate/2-oxoglutarate dehydrogenase complex dihydrolipoamide acyltransferase (E2) component